MADVLQFGEAHYWRQFSQAISQFIQRKIYDGFQFPMFVTAVRRNGEMFHARYGLAADRTLEQMVLANWLPDPQHRCGFSEYSEASWNFLVTDNRGESDLMVFVGTNTGEAA